MTSQGQQETAKDNNPQTTKTANYNNPRRTRTANDNNPQNKNSQGQ